MKKITISFENYKEFDELRLVDFLSMHDVLYDELDFLNTVSSSFVENEEDLIQFTEDAGFGSVYSCALDLLTSYGKDRGTAELLYDLELITIDDIVLYRDAVNESVAFLKRFLLNNAIWKAV